MVKDLSGEDFSSEVIEQIEPIVKLRAKGIEIYQFKYLLVLIREVSARMQLQKEGTEIKQTKDG